MDGSKLEDAGPLKTTGSDLSEKRVIRASGMNERERMNENESTLVQ